MPDPLPVSHPLRLGSLSSRKPTRFDLMPSAEACTALALVLGISAISDLRFKGTISPVGRTDFVLEADLAARVIQPCVITLEPVVTQIATSVVRRYLAEIAEPTGDEAEMPDDDTAEPLPDVLDVGAVMAEALALALPDYPRKPDAELGEAVHAGPGVTPLRDSALKPFAGLASLAGKLGGGRPDGNGGGQE